METEGDEPFDARRVWRTDSEGPCTEWSTVALVTGLRALLADLTYWHFTEPNGDHAIGARRDVSDITDVLIDRGIDADSLVRYGLLPEIIVNIYLVLVLPALAPDETAPVQAVANYRTWRDAFRLREPEIMARAQDVLAHPESAGARVIELLFSVDQSLVSAFADVAMWLSIADIEDIVAIRAPTDEEIGEARRKAPHPDLALFNDYRWMIDRFSSTYLHEWNLESLHSEYRWIQGAQNAPCPVPLMETRPISREELNAEIARRSVMRRGAQGSIPSGSPAALPTPPLAYQIFSHARRFLRQRRLREAAAMFEFIVHTDPGNADALNNLGFCLIPRRPRQALRHLQTAREAGYTPSIVNLYNTMCCYIAIGQPGVALRLARMNQHIIDGENVGLAVLWRCTPGVKWVLVENVQPREELQRLLESAEKLNQPSRPIEDYEQDDPLSRLCDNESPIVLSGEYTVEPDPGGENEPGP